MAQETHQNEPHESINLRNSQLQHPNALALLNNYTTSGEVYNTHQVSYSPAKLSSVSTVSNAAQLFGGDSVCVAVCSASHSNYTPQVIQGVPNSANTGLPVTCYSSGPMPHGHSNTTSTQPAMLETIFSRNAYNSQVPVAHPPRVLGTTVSTAQVSNQGLSVMSNSGIRNSTGASSSHSTSLSYSAPATNSGVATDPGKCQLIHQQLVLLLHAHRCQRQETENNGRINPCPTPHCKTMREVLQHMATCSKGKDCPKAHCASSRQIINHYKNCSSRDCVVCEPLKQNQHCPRNPLVRQQQGQAQMHGYPSRVPEINGVEAPPQSLSNPILASHQPVRIATLNNPVTTQAVNVRLQNSGKVVVPTSEPSNVNGVNHVSPNSATIDRTGWRKDVNMAQRTNVVRRIVRFIFPFPDSAAYSDPRMKNLIEYARKVEREMYNTATDMQHYFDLLAQKCYKIQCELEEKRKTRQLNVGTSTTGTSTNSTMTTTTTTATPTTSSSQLGQTLSSLSTQLASSPSSLQNVFSGSTNRSVNTVNGTYSGPSTDSLETNSYTTQESNNSKGEMFQFEHYLQENCQRYKPEASTTGPSEPPSNASSTSSSFSAVTTTVSSLKPSLDDMCKPTATTVATSISEIVPNKIKPIKTEFKPEDSTIEVSSVNDSFTAASNSSMSSNTQTPVSIKPDESKWKKWSREELLMHFLQLHEEINNDKSAEPFRAPVDPVALQIPDYFQVIKEPMDLNTIRHNLEDGKYTDPWQVVEHFRLMFNNAWLYNKKTSKVYKMCTKSRIDRVMQAMGFCCGQDFEYQPQGLYCSSANLCTINRDSNYYVYMNNDKQATGLVCDKYYQCEKCFADAGDTIILADEPNQSVPIKKEFFEKRKNNVKEKEELVVCIACGRRWHKVCALHMNEIWPAGFVCPGCSRERGIKRPENKFTAKKLPVTRLSTFLEKRVNDFLKKKEVGTGEVTIRVLASSDKTVEVKPLMRARFTESGELPDSFPYRLKAVFAFQEIDGQDVCFFGLYVQEYGSDSPQPNCRRVYVAYLDSVFFFRPKQYRTDVYHEILVGYLQYAKCCGYTMAHIWACPPGEGDDYIFHMHPAEQKIPKAKRLQDWYRRMLQKAIIEGIVVDYKNILKDALDHQLVSPTEIPYFEGDFWPNTLEDILKELEEEEARRRREEAMAQAEAEDDDTDSAGLSNDRLSGDSEKRSGKKKAKKRKGNKKGNTSTASKRKRLDGPVDGAEELSRKVYDTMEKLKEIFFVIRLHRHNHAASLAPTSDLDQPIHSELMDSRDAFLQMARERHLEFSSLRRAKYSTMVLLYELHMELRQSFMYNCNVCGAQIETRWHCNECEEYDLCSRCYKTENHPHSMVKYGLGIDEDSGNTDESTDRPNTAVDQRSSIERCIKSLLHACQCRDANCRMQTCTQMKRVLCHTRNCTKKATNSCLLCRQLLSLLWHHARCCEESKCPVPFCSNIKYRVKQKQLQQRLQQNKLLRRRISTMHRGAVPTSESQALPIAGSNPSTAPLTCSSSLSNGSQTQTHSPFHQSPAGTPGRNTQSVVISAPDKAHPISSPSFPSGSAGQSQVPHNPMPVSTGVSLQNQQPRLPVQNPCPQTSQLTVSRAAPSNPAGIVPGNRVIVQPSQHKGSVPHQSSAAIGVTTAGFRVRPVMTVTGSIANSQQPIPQSQPISSAGQKAIPIASMAKAKSEDVTYIHQVINYIKNTGCSKEEQNRQFLDWIKRHPEYHAAFFTLHSQNKQQQAELRAQSSQRRVSATSNYGGTGSTTASPVVNSTVTDSALLSGNAVSGNVVIVPPASTNLSAQGSVPRVPSQNMPTNNPSLSALPVVTAGTPSAIVHQPVQWISIQSPATTNHQPLITGCASQPGQAISNTTLRFRPIPGTTTLVQSQPQQVQHFYNSSLGPDQTFSGTDSSSGIFVSATGANLVSVGGQQSQVFSSVSQRINAASNPNLATIGRQSATPQAAIVQFRHQQHQSLGGAVNPIQPHIILANTSAAAAGPTHVPHHSQPQLVSTSSGGRQVVALMTHQGISHTNVPDAGAGLHDPNTPNINNPGSGLGNGIQ